MTLEIAALTWVTPFLLLLLYSIATEGNSFIGSMKQADAALSARAKEV